MKTFLGLVILASLTAEVSNASPLRRMQCDFNGLYIDFSFREGKDAGEADFTIMHSYKVHGKYVPLPEHFFGPLSVRAEIEGTHYAIEGTDFLFLVKPSPYGGFTGLLRKSPTPLAALKLPAGYFFSCRE